MTDNTITDAYLACEGLRDDPAQRQVVGMLAALQVELRQRAVSWRRQLARLPLVPPAPPVTGLYLWGGVGRGKTFLMDLFFDTLGVAASRRVHFHRMMQDVHARLGRHARARDPLDLVAAEIASEAEVLCFDEFFVSDIGDAMLLGRLLDGLFRARTFRTFTRSDAAQLGAEPGRVLAVLDGVVPTGDNTNIVGAVYVKSDAAGAEPQLAGTFAFFGWNPAHADMGGRRYVVDVTDVLRDQAESGTLGDESVEFELRAVPLAPGARAEDGGFNVNSIELVGG